MKRPFILLISGPTGVGKTTLSKMLSRYYGCAYISEDELAKGLFPDKHQNVEDYPDKLRLVENKLLEEISRCFHTKASVIVDVINLEERFLRRIGKDFTDRVILRVLYPSMETAIKRDSKRTGWTSGEKAIKQFYRKYEELRPMIGQENYIDNSNLTPRKTLEILIASITDANES